MHRWIQIEVSASKSDIVEKNKTDSAGRDAGASSNISTPQKGLSLSATDSLSKRVEDELRLGDWSGEDMVRLI